jgi:hypothetical protein
MQQSDRQVKDLPCGPSEAEEKEGTDFGYIGIGPAPFVVRVRGARFR